MVGSLVCEACHGRCVVSRYPQCGVGNCSGARGRARRLRHLPPRWYDLSTETRHQISTEMREYLFYSQDIIAFKHYIFLMLERYYHQNSHQKYCRGNIAWVILLGYYVIACKIWPTVIQLKNTRVFYSG